MKAKYIAILILSLITTSIFSQSNLNSYKYVIVPTKYEFLKEKDQYQLNSLTEFLFNKYGFQAIIEGSDYPDDLKRNRCLALKSDLIKDSSMFKTKLTVELKNCSDQVVFTSKEGESREKEYNKAYTQALREAFQSIEGLNYKFEPNAAMHAQTPTVVTNNDVTNEIQKLKEEIQTLKNEKEIVVEEKIEPKDVIVEKVEEKEVPITIMPTKEVAKKELKQVEKLKVDEVPSGILYAQVIENGFQLVDSTPKVVYRIKKTGIEGVFLVENKNATLYKKGADWILEYYENNILKQDILNIKF